MYDPNTGMEGSPAMAENTETMKAGDNPDDFTNDQVNAYLATADQAERDRVLTAEKDGQARKGILDGYSDTDTETATGLSGTGNPNDLATPGADSNVSANIAHQEGAPEALTQAADEAAEQGYLGQTAEKPDYSQSNPAVMNQDG